MEATLEFIQQWKDDVGDVWTSGKTYDQYIDFFLERFLRNDFRPFRDLDSFEVAFRSVVPKQERFLNLAPMFKTESFRLCGEEFTVLSRKYSVTTGWIYELSNGWYVQEYMGVLSAKHYYPPFGTTASLISSDKIVPNYIHEDDSPMCYYNFESLGNALRRIVVLFGRNSTQDVYFDLYKVANETKQTIGYVKSNNARLGITYQDEDGSYWIVTEIYKNTGDQFVIAIVNGSDTPARRIKDSDFRMKRTVDKKPLEIGSEVQCLIPGREFVYGIVAATSENQIGIFHELHCAVVSQGESRWYPWPTLDKIGFKEHAFHTPKNITGFVPYTDIKSKNIYLENISEKVDVDDVVPAESAVRQKINYTANSIRWAGGAAILLLAINLWVAK